VHQVHLPTPFLSSVINDCLPRGIDVTAGGARFNLSGIQAIQVANIADSLSVLRSLIFEQGAVKKQEMLDALRNNFEGKEILRQRCMNAVPKYGNDVEWVDNTGAKWIKFFAENLKKYRNQRGGVYHMGLYTVSAHVPMGQNVGATPDGRLARSVLADGGVSPMTGRDKLGPTAVLRSVSRLPFEMAGNGALLNMKFLPSFFRNKEDRKNFSALLKAFIKLKIHHVQFNVVNREDLINARKDPDSYKGLTVRVAGYTAYFTELAEDLQNEIIERTVFGDGV
jgi:formate C-acetyltransferase